MDNIFKINAAEQLAEATRKAFPESISAIGESLNIKDSDLADFFASKLEIPRDAKMGDYAFPTFILAKVLKKKPPEIANLIFRNLDSSRFSLAGPYINLNLSPEETASEILPEIFSQRKNYASQQIGNGKSVVIDFSSPNIAKPFGVGHLRSTAIGNSLYRLYEKLGYKVIGINHLGDWGTQFGKLITAYRRWGNKVELNNNPIKYLYDLYVKFHEQEAMEDASGIDIGLEEEARDWFKKLEDGDDEAIILWQGFKDYSLMEFKRIYDLLGVYFDHYTGESFYNDKMDAVIERLSQAGLTSESQGALIVDLSEHGLNPCLLRKGDGATLYATRDLAGIFYRHDTYKFEKALYVVGSAQQDHFKQVFKVVEMLGESFARNLVHVEFGWIRFKDQAMSTRKGNIIFLDDVIDTAEDRVKKIMMEKNPDLPNLEQTARQVGIGAVIFADLGVKRHKDVNFSWEEVLNFEGETGPYLQYTHARLCALKRKYGKDITANVDYSKYISREEKALALHLYRFGEIVELAADKYEPNFIAEYLIGLATVFNRFYQRKGESGRLIKIIDDSAPDETASRMLLVDCVRIVLKEGLYLLGIEAPDEM
ncbi:MAG: arginine--tRNA ligase [candidate division Zixibacteria bacterium]